MGGVIGAKSAGAYTNHKKENAPTQKKAIIQGRHKCGGEAMSRQTAGMWLLLPVLLSHRRADDIPPSTNSIIAGVIIA